ncbi:hypothetical protein HHX48_00450 [Salinimonas sp. HHU 13199]|uniref:DUF4136 domain-containing protein n=1 Tax=Salinimonas profundi TaxID=2729140 RepID=A0ABR8LIR6_9ALTE|nr:hypothetical protein [Salinimonas profundi]MBD3584202.1 hypothetical protein [Salinimonas profundi]
MAVFSNIKKPVRALVAVTLLSSALGACSSFSSSGPTAYKSAKSADAYGYSSVQLDDAQYRVMFKAAEDTPADLVQEYTLYRAAEIADEQGYSWVAIVKTDIERKANISQRIVRDKKNTLPPVLKEEQCTMSGCNDVAQPFEVSDSDLRTKKTKTQDVYYSVVARMGNSQVSTGDNAFEVEKVLARLSKVVNP